MLGHIVLVCVANSRVKGIYQILDLSKYVSWTHFLLLTHSLGTDDLAAVKF